MHPSLRPSFFAFEAKSHQAYPRQGNDSGGYLAPAGLPIALCVTLATVGAACGTHSSSPRARLTSICHKPYASLSPSESIDCVAAGYYRVEVKEAQRAYRREQQRERL